MWVRLLSDALEVDFLINIVLFAPTYVGDCKNSSARFEVKGVGQECPTHTNRWRLLTVDRT